MISASVSEKHRKNAVFVMNAVTLHELYRTLRYGPRNLLTSRDDDSFMVMVQISRGPK